MSPLSRVKEFGVIHRCLAFLCRRASRKSMKRLFTMAVLNINQLIHLTFCLFPVFPVQAGGNVLWLILL